MLEQKCIYLSNDSYNHYIEFTKDRVKKIVIKAYQRDRLQI